MKEFISFLNQKSLQSLHVDLNTEAGLVERYREVSVLSENKLVVQQEFISEWVLVSVELYDGLVLHVCRVAGVGGEREGGDSVESSGQTHPATPDMGNQDHTETAG